MLSNEIRQSFLDFFKSKKHHIVPSAPVIPAQDPTLLFTNAGMNQFKEVFLGIGTREYTRVADSQKCIRVGGKHNDIEEVGADTYHHTFFEMLGNWSFGDYYKKEAITWAWELFTEVWKLEKDRLYATVFREDDEAEELWLSETDIAKERVSRLDEKDNFWEMGDTGPCGPCSEIHYDYGEEYSCGPDCEMGCECGRFVELWNLVFIQYNREDDGSLVELPAKHVDTGMGFERITAVLQGKRSNYDTDIFTPIMDAVSEMTGLKYEEETYVGVAFRVLADHIRALTFAIADGALPSNEGRGYVLRRILRRGARYGRELNMHEPFIYKLVDPLVEKLGKVYPEIKDSAEYIAKVIRSEEESFGKTLDRGIEIFNRLADNAVKSGNNKIPGKDAFQLYDTYGFPLDLTELMAREKKLSVDTDGFDNEMAEQKKRSFSKKTMTVGDGFGDDDITTKFDYILEELTTSVAAIIDVDGKELKSAQKGMEVNVQLKDSTPFYPEAGGQVGDTGTFTRKDGTVIAEILETQKTGEDKILHRAKIVDTALETGEQVVASVDRVRRLDIRRNHTATHLMHKALKEVLGTHVQQAGSLVAPDYLRFDFNHFQKMTDEEIEKVEAQVNGMIRRNTPVEPLDNVPFNEAKERGAVALFGEKYGDRVRMIRIGDYSLELCGGTHIDYIGNIGEFRIVSETAVSAGVRRIVAETGIKAQKRTEEERKTLAHLKEILNTDTPELAGRIESLLEERKNLEKTIKEISQKSAEGELEGMIDSALKDGDPPLLASEFTVSSVDELKEMGDTVRMKMPGGAALLGAAIEDKAMLVCVVGDRIMQESKWQAGAIVKELSKKIGGGGGGRPHMATAGIKDPSKLKEAIELFPEVIKSIYNI